MRRALRMGLMVVVIAMPGCIVVTCGSTPTLETEQRASTSEASAADTSRGAGSRW